MKNTEKNLAVTESVFEGILSRIASNEVADDARETLDSGLQIVSRKYNLENAQGKRNDITITDANLILHMDKIDAARKGSSIMAYVVCKELSHISEIDLTGYGFKDIADFARHVWGISPNTCNQYIRIGQAFITDSYTPIKGLPASLPVSHMLELLSYATVNGKIDVSRIQALYIDGTLKDGMTTKMIRNALKSPELDEHKEEKKGGRKAKEHKAVEVAEQEEISALSQDELIKACETCIDFLLANYDAIQNKNAIVGKVSALMLLMK